MSNSKALVLEQVRESYRFLYEYQARVLNLLTYIEKRLGITYSGGYSKFSTVTPRNGKGNLGLWAWDWLNMYFYEFHFGFYNGNLVSQPYKDQGNNLFGLSIFLLSDDGYFQAHPNEINNSGRIQLESFKSVQESNTKLFFVASKHCWDTSLWHSGQKACVPSDEFISMDSGRHDVDIDKFMIFKSFNLEAFFEESSALKCLAEFHDLCAINGIPFKVLSDLKL